MENAEQFIEAINPRSRELAHGSWIFRGHSSDQYELLPTALRSVGEFHHWYFRNVETTEEQIEAEWDALSHFFEAADRNGVLAPDVSSHLRDLLDAGNKGRVMELVRKGKLPWLPDGLLYVAAIAQHHGVPTRLLDWTNHPNTAAYFAARDVVRGVWKDRDPDENLAVWAFSSGLHLMEGAAAEIRHLYGKERTSFRPLRLVSVSAAGNQNLHAQRGVFTLFRPQRVRFSAAVDRRPLDVLLPGAMPSMGLHRPEHPEVWAMKRFTMPTRFAADLLHLLDTEGVSGSSLFPGVQGVVAAMKERIQRRTFESSLENLRSR